MIQHKIGRILNGDQTYDDSWKDIAGYATLIVNELNGEIKYCQFSIMCVMKTKFGSTLKESMIKFALLIRMVGSLVVASA